MSKTPYLPAIEDALYSHAFLHFCDVTAEIASAQNMNGPAGRMTGKEVMEYLDECHPGKRIEDLTIDQVTRLILRVRTKYAKEGA